jgi:NAD(P)H-dependent FMN reductase
VRSVLAVVGSPSASSRTRSLADAILDGVHEAAGVGAGTEIETEVIVLGDYSIAFADGTRAEDQLGDTLRVLESIARADAFVLATPIYRASLSGILKNILDLVPRGFYDGHARPFQAKPVVVAATAASLHHFLGLDELATIMRGFFSAYVIPPGVFATHEDFSADGELTSPAAIRHAHVAGRALLAMDTALLAHPELRAVEPAL